MASLEIKFKITTLWILLGFTLTLVFTLKDSDPGNGGLQQMFVSLPAQQLSLLLLGDAAIRLIPFVLAFLTLILNDTLSRRVNLGLGLIFTIASLYGLVAIVSNISVSTAYELLTQAMSIAAAVLIFRYAYLWRKEISPHTVRTPIRPQSGRITR